MTDKQLPPLPTLLYTRVVDGIPCISVSEHEHLMRTYALQAIQQAEAPHTATAIACGIPGMAKTTCPYCEQGFAFEFKQAEAKMDEPVYQICRADSVSISTAWVNVQKQQYDDAVLYPEYVRRVLYTHPAPGVPDGVVRDAISTVREQYRGTDWGKEAECICDAIDAAMTAAQAQKGD
jgi:hypothetical protein